MKNSIRKAFSQRPKLGPYGLLLVILLLVGFFIKISALAYPIFTEAGRDYLISYHIYAYNEFIFAGPSSSAIGHSLYSPLLYYLLALFLMIEDSIFSFGLINIFFQTFTIIVIYLIAKNLFNSRTALIASTLFTFSFVALLQANHVWQPYMMQPFINLAYLLLILAYVKKNYFLLLVSSFIFIAGALMHASAFAVMPMFLLAAFLILKTQHAPISRHVFFMMAFAGSFLFMHLPTLIYSLTQKNAHMNVLKFFYDVTGRVFYFPSPYNFFQNLFHNASGLINQFFFHTGQPLLSINALLLLLLVLNAILYFFYSQKNTSKKIYLLVILGFIANLLLFGSLLTGSFYDYYFTPVLALFVILVAEVINTVFSRNTILKTAKILIVVTLVYIFSNPPMNVRNYRLHILANISSVASAVFSQPQGASEVKQIEFFRQQRTVRLAIDAIKKEIFEIQRKDAAKDINFFQFKAYRPEGDAVDSIFWALLEKDLNQKFVIVSDSSDEYFKYELINDDDYIFLVCHAFSDDKGCIDMFLVERQNYSIIKDVFYEKLLQVFLAKKL